MENGGDGEGGRSRRNINTNDTNALAGLTLGAVLSKKQTAANRIRERTLLDMIREDPTYGKDAKKTWKTFRDKLRLKRAGAAWTSTVPIPASDIPIQRNSSRTMMMRRGSSRYPTDSEDPNEAARLSTVPSGRSTSLRRNASRLPDRQQSRLLPVETDPPEEERAEGESPGGDGEAGGYGEGGNGGQEGGGGGPVVKMSLMALLAETDREMGLDSAYLDDDEEEEEEEEEEEGDENSGEYNNCCVCMVRHKGAAFIPCGHTFCRLCSRELWVQRGNCPLCNNFILEILDIF